MRQAQGTYSYVDPRDTKVSQNRHESSSEMSREENDTLRRKICFVTIGATANFDPLISVVCSSDFLDVLLEYGYTDLRIQHGKTNILQEHEKRRRSDPTDQRDIKIAGFDFKKEGLDVDMRDAKGGAKSTEGVVISHAGTIPVPSSSLSTIILKESIRFRNHPRRPSNQRPPHRRAEPQSFG